MTAPDGYASDELRRGPSDRPPTGDRSSLWDRRRVIATLPQAALLLVVACSSDGSDDTPAPENDSAAADGGTPPAAATPSASPRPSVAPRPEEAAVAARVLEATEAFLAALDAAQRTTAVTERTRANLTRWSNLPDRMFRRDGLRMDALTEDQNRALLKILEAALSPQGYEQVLRIMTADGLLAAEGGFDWGFGADRYWVRFIGTPSRSDPWTIQFGGHHLGLNVTVDGARMTLAPTHWGAQPAAYAEGGADVEPLGGETRKAFGLMAALTAAQQSSAILQSPIRDIVLGPGQDGKVLVPEGVSASTFTPPQKERLLALMQDWIEPLNVDHAASRIATARAEIDQTTFAWSGSTTEGKPVYYRIQSPSFTIEFAHQRSPFGDADSINHIHAMYRETGNDYGGAT